MQEPKTPVDASAKDQLRAGAGATGEYVFEIAPSSPTRRSTISVSVANFNPATAQIAWLVNNVPAASEQEKLIAGTAKRGDTVQAIAHVEGKEILSNVLTIKNDPPEISRIKIMPEVFGPGDTLSVDAAASDADGDDVSITYEWTRNGQDAGNRERIEGPLKRGDKVAIKVTPFDGNEPGRSVILTREIRNLPPVITASADYVFDGKVYSYHVRATDPDGDALTYSLKTAPPGMMIDKATGLITWSVPEEIRGKISITVSVSDGKGGEAVYPFTVDMARAR